MNPKTIEEVKAAKRELELKISQAVNEFSVANGVRLTIDVREIDVIVLGEIPRYLYDCRVELKL